MQDIDVTESVRQNGPFKSDSNGEISGGHFLWPTILGLSAAAVILFALFRQTTLSMISMWHYDSYSHGYLVLPISVWLIYAIRKRLVPLEPTPNPWALVLLAGLGFGWFLGDVAGIQAIKQGAVVGMLPALAWLIFGTCITRAMLFPLLFLFFAVPVGEGLVPPLQDVTAFFATKGLDLIGVPVLLERRMISIPSGNWEVAEACSGLRFLTASLVLGCFYAYVVYRSWTRRIIFVLICIIFPIVANGLRAFGIILLGHLTQNRLAAGVDHLIYGGVFFGLVLFVLFAAGWPWRETGPLAGAHSSLGRPSRPTSENLRRTFHRRQVLWATLGIALVAIAPLFAHRLNDIPSAPTALNIASVPVLPPWKPSVAGLGGWKPVSVETSSELKETYTSGPREILLYVAYYAGGSGGRKLVSSSNLISEGSHWATVGEGRIIAALDEKPVSVHETVLRNQGANLVVWSWYWIDGQFTDDPYRAKLLRVKAQLFGGIQASAFIAVGSYYSVDRAEAANALQDFLRHTSLQSALKRVSN